MQRSELAWCGSRKRKWITVAREENKKANMGVGHYKSSTRSRDHVKKFGFYSECDRKHWRVLNRKKSYYLTFSNDHSGCCIENRHQWDKSGTGRKLE